MSRSKEPIGSNGYQVTGNLGFATVPEVWRQSRVVLESLADPIIDLGKVTAVDSAGLALVIEWLRWARSRGKSLTYINVPPDLLALARISEVEGLIRKATRPADQVS